MRFQQLPVYPFPDFLVFQVRLPFAHQAAHRKPALALLRLQGLARRCAEQRPLQVRWAVTEKYDAAPARGTVRVLQPQLPARIFHPHRSSRREEALTFLAHRTDEKLEPPHVGGYMPSAASLGFGRGDRNLRKRSPPLEAVPAFRAQPQGNSDVDKPPPSEAGPANIGARNTR